MSPSCFVSSSTTPPILRDHGARSRRWTQESLWHAVASMQHAGAAACTKRDDSTPLCPPFFARLARCVPQTPSNAQGQHQRLRGQRQVSGARRGHGCAQGAQHQHHAGRGWRSGALPPACLPPRAAYVPFDRFRILSPPPPPGESNICMHCAVHVES